MVEERDESRVRGVVLECLVEWTQLKRETTVSVSSHLSFTVVIHVCTQRVGVYVMYVNMYLADDSRLLCVLSQRAEGQLSLVALDEVSGLKLRGEEALGRSEH
jgi:hypothetical protein